MSLSELLMEPSLASIDLESPARIEVHQKILARKKMIKNVFLDFYRALFELDKQFFKDTAGSTIELGAGVSLIKEFDPNVIVTDIVAGTHLDRQMDALNTGLDSQSVRSLYGQNCFHHFPSVKDFFDEANRVLKPGGGVILIEPYYGFFAKLLYKRLFASETFDKNDPKWGTNEKLAMLGANQALSHNVFVRDRVEFEAKFPQFEICFSSVFDNYLRYLLSGGLNFKSIAPAFAEKSIKIVEKLLSPFKPIFGLHWIIVVRKKGGPC